MQKDDLRNLLSSLVDDCGYDAVREALEDFDPALSAPVSKKLLCEAQENQGRKSSILWRCRMRGKRTDGAQGNGKGLHAERQPCPRPQEGKDVSRIKSRGQVALADWETSRLQELRGLYGPPKDRSIESFGRRNRQKHKDATERMERLPRASSR